MHVPLRDAIDLHSREPQAGKAGHHHQAFLFTPSMAYMTGWFDDVCLVLKPYVENVVSILVVNTAHIGRYLSLIHI